MQVTRAGFIEILGGYPEGILSLKVVLQKLSVMAEQRDIRAVHNSSVVSFIDSSSLLPVGS